MLDICPSASHELPAGASRQKRHPNGCRFCILNYTEHRVLFVTGTSAVTEALVGGLTDKPEGPLWQILPVLLPCCNAIFRLF